MVLAEIHEGSEKSPAVYVLFNETILKKLKFINSATKKDALLNALRKAPDNKLHCHKTADASTATKYTILSGFLSTVNWKMLSFKGTLVDNPTNDFVFHPSIFPLKKPFKNTTNTGPLSNLNLNRKWQSKRSFPRTKTIKSISWQAQSHLGLTQSQVASGAWAELTLASSQIFDILLPFHISRNNRGKIPLVSELNFLNCSNTKPKLTKMEPLQIIQTWHLLVLTS